MPGTRGIERGPITLSNSPPKAYSLHSSLTSHMEENDNSSSAGHERLSTKKSVDFGRRSNSSAKHSTNSARRQRSNTDIQSVPVFNHNLKQQSPSNHSGSDKALNQSQNMSNKPISQLPYPTIPSGYITSSKLFNMMAYGLENQYFFMHSNYLYIIDCRTREEFECDHIVTGTETDPFIFFLLAF